VAPFLFATALLLISVSAIIGYSLHRVTEKKAAELLISQNRKQLAFCREALTEFRRAVANDPFSAASVNGVVYCQLQLRTAVATGRESEAVLSKIGWRNTPVLQNRLTLAAQRRDVREIFDLLDALLRRNQLSREITQLMNDLETSEVGRQIIAERIKAAVPWGDRYLRDVSGLKRLELLQGRAKLLNKLIKQQVRISEPVLSPVLFQMVNNGLTTEAGELWRKSHGVAASGQVLSDPNFSRYVSFSPTSENRSPFDWYTSNSEGASVHALSSGRSKIEISWDGKNSPILLAQQVSAPIGRYEFQLIAERVIRDAWPYNIIFNVRCPDGRTTSFPAAIRQNSRDETVYYTAQFVDCPNFVFELAAKVSTDEDQAIGAQTMRHDNVPQLRVIKVIATVS